MPAGREPQSPPGLGADAGPHPVARAIVGLLLGAGAGLLAALLIPRPQRATRRPPMSVAG